MSNQTIKVLVNGISNSYGGVESIFYSLLECNDPNVQFDFISNACNRDLIKMFSDKGSKVSSFPTVEEVGAQVYYAAKDVKKDDINKYYEISGF